LPHSLPVQEYLQQTPAWQALPPPQSVPLSSALQPTWVVFGRHFKHVLSGLTVPEGTQMFPTRQK